MSTWRRALAAVSRLRGASSRPWRVAPRPSSAAGFAFASPPLGRRALGASAALPDTIFALSSAPGRAGVAVIRVSGPAARDVLRLLPPSRRASPPKHREAVFTRFARPDTGEVLDRGVFLWFDAPRSLTGEDVAELHVHGSLAVVRGVLDAIAALRPPPSPTTTPSRDNDDALSSSTSVFRAAEPGEFVRRAFRNDKLDLTQAEGLADLLDAETAAQRRQALAQSGGVLRAALERWRSRLVRATARVEATLDFGDAELDVVAADAFERAAVPEVVALRREIDAALRAPPRAELVRSGVRVVLVGAPNVGKSSLLNVLAGRPAAIVSDVPGTTRDAVEVAMELGGFKIIVTDTAGARETDDPVEREGIRRSESHAGAAHVTVAVADAAEIVRGARGGSFGLPAFAAAPDVLVVNKSDLADPEETRRLVNDALEALSDAPALSPTVIGVSCVTSEGVDALVAALTAKAEALTSGGTGDDAHALAVTRARHRGRLEACVAHLRAFERIAAAVHGVGGGAQGTGGDVQTELAAEELRLAADALGAVTGKVDVEEILDVVFADFCVGK